MWTRRMITKEEALERRARAKVKSTWESPPGTQPESTQKVPSQFCPCSDTVWGRVSGQFPCLFIGPWPKKSILGGSRCRDRTRLRMVAFEKRVSVCHE